MQPSGPGFELVLPCPIPTTITITPLEQALFHVFISYYMNTSEHTLYLMEALAIFTYLWWQVGRDVSIHRLHFCRRVRPHSECSRYDTKEGFGEASVMLDLLGMRITLSLPSLPGQL